MRQWLLQKLTRERLDLFLDEQALTAPVLEVGASSRAQRERYAPLIASDIIYHSELDVVHDAHHLPFVDNSVPSILCLEVLEHCHTPQQVIDEFYRVLQPNGTLILTTRFIFPIHDAPHDYYRYTQYGLQHLMRDFSEVTIVPEAHTVVTMGVLYQRLAYQVDWHVPFTKIFFLLIAKLMPLLQKTLKREYGDIRKDTTVSDILASGYYVVAKR
ncbi:MAG: class I SAM-dependent methyltransferase [Chloroflexota bacterium]